MGRDCFSIIRKPSLLVFGCQTKLCGYARDLAKWACSNYFFSGMNKVKSDGNGFDDRRPRA